MSKRKQTGSDSDSDDNGEVNLINVDFDFFDPNPDVDFHALKRLIVQVFQTDAEHLFPSDLADLILSQPQVGSTVKTDGKESDPYAILTAINMHQHKDNPSIRALAEYALLKSQGNPAFSATLQSLLGSSDASSRVGLIFSERLINMPVQVVPHMYRMLADELQAAIAKNEPYNFSHLLLFSRIYRLSPEEEAALNAQSTPSQTKKRRAQQTHLQTSANGIYSFHHEDPIIQKLALHSLDYDFTNTQPREEDAFGLNLGGRMVLLSADKLPQLVSEMTEAFST
ncbi:hypothetical protein PENSPDRAFT_730368 [Peniophora sp. CONT]|nr:hypothetical protein PENSPDRAFT_730368 [Peniophora sp. CONT]